MNLKQFFLITILSVTLIVGCSSYSNNVDVCVSCIQKMSQHQYEILASKAKAGDADSALELWRYHQKFQDDNEKAKLFYGLNFVEPGDEYKVTEGINILNLLGKEGDLDAKFELSAIYLSGKYVKQDLRNDCILLSQLKAANYSNYVDDRINEFGCDKPNNN